MGFVLVVSTFGPWFLWPTRMTLVGRQLGFARQRLRRHGQLGDGHFAERLPLRLGKRNSHALIHTLDFVEQVIRGYVFLHHVTSVNRATPRVHRQHVIRDQRHAKGKQPRFRISQPRLLALQRRLQNLEQRFDLPTLPIQTRHRAGLPAPADWSIHGSPGRHRGSASANATQVVARSGFRRSWGCPAEPFAPHLHVIAFARVLQFRDRRPRQVLVLPDHEASLTLGDAEQKAQRAKIAILDPHVVRLDRGQNLVEQGTLLRCPSSHGNTLIASINAGSALPETCRATDPPRPSAVPAGGVRSWPGNCRRGS